ncbi:MAG: excinuclease ABC subunit UvrC [Verrucomicrobia bacterium]|nr:excinuclease ABC subunit UvrC [Verrucomicrobiota bacterium]MBT5064126.1 excinuclease ABC subunit UvrC [Verrucomicrobiota bacterium]MBT5478635.1 excinuclease ABC subunit UvrC [Verrucomicrobiota bacterium]MBT6236784.1 excinuclease ABC subunit UvrC [Verrucomicrobiota bacterium]MBT7534425.1 excinuclease ABC subunit UvrC [Verrucomicrobiota bacterium]
MKDRFGTVIYIGKARSLRKRVSQYFHPSRRQRWDMKLNALVEAIHDLDVHQVRSEPDAVLLEGKLIKEFKPRYNVSFKDDKRFLLLKVNLKDPIPRFTLTRLRQDDGARYFGPFANSGAIRRTMTMVRQKFSLRGCRPLTPNKHDYKHCLYGHLKHCTAPCIDNISTEDYLKQVEAACEFLTGQSQEMEKDLKQMMQKAAERLDFEKAAELRDMLQDLKKATQKTGKFSRLPYKLPLAIDPVSDLTELRKVLSIRKIPVRIEGFDISNISGTFKVASMVRFRNGRPDRSNYRRYKMKTVQGQDDFACMAETVRRRYTRLLKEAGEQKTDLESSESPFPELILIDGGKGQLGAACEELAKLGLSKIPIIGLAKEFEEIYQPGKPDPIRLDHRSGALKLLQRVRDESHRFANTFNAQLRLKKISESLLDEFPGIGQSRKAALLKKFGSVQRIKTASMEEISQLPGFGGKTAEKLKLFLAAR